jgi:Carboxypeptidase regulatory-like domain
MRAAVISMILLGASSCDGVLSVRGRVVDETGRPVSGAQVSAYYISPQTSAITDDRGCFRLFKITRPFEHQVPFLVQAAGYQTLLGEITCPEDERVTAHLSSLEKPERSLLKRGSVDAICESAGPARP